MIIGEKFNSELTGRDFDIIVIGSGISGLTLANLQAKQGKSVLVFEKHYTAGGLTHTYSRKGFEWDSGLHYVGEVHDESNPFRKLFDFLSDGSLKWSSLPDNYDTFVYPDREYRLLAGEDQFVTQLLDAFPDEARAIKEYVGLIKTAPKKLSRMMAAKLGPRFLRKPLTELSTSNLFRHSTYDVLRSLTSNQRLISVLTSQWGNYGLPPRRSSFGVHATIATHYLEGGNYPSGGSSQIARTLVKSIEASGGKVIVGAGVKEILVHRGCVVGIALESGPNFRGKKVVSSAGVYSTIKNLLPPEILTGELRAYAENIPRSVGYLSLNIGISGPLPDRINGGNYWIYPDYDHDVSFSNYMSSRGSSPLPMCYITFPSLKDDSWKLRHGTNSCIDILGLADNNWFHPWDKTQTRRRPQDYEDFKLKLAAPYFRELFRIIPELAGNLSHTEISTPLTVRHYVNNSAGEIYGQELSPERFMQPGTPPSPPIPGLYLTGQDVAIHGICGAMMSGVLTSMAISPVDTFLQIRKTGVV